MNATTVPTATALVDGLRIRYADSGADGPVILLTSPWPESLLAFRRIWPDLAGTARLVSLDLPGFGHSEGRADVFTPSAMGEFLLRFITERGLGAPHLVAPDVGASAALFLAARHPGAVRSLVVGGGAAAFPLEVTGTLADIIAAPGIEACELSVLTAGHFAWEQVPGQFASMVADWVARAQTAPSGPVS
jgi:pimeloyl-ACP methyl ester carboxylesterase